MSHTKETIKLWAGTVLEVLAPWVTHDLDTDRHSGRFIKLKHWILYARTARARARGDADALQKSLFQFWRTDTADTYFDKYLDRHDKWFLGPHHEIVDQLAMLTSQHRYTRLIEIGCGNGRVLEHCAAAMPNVTEFIGVDINPTIIDRDRVDYAQNSRLQFLTTDASAWLETTARPGSILLTYGGVMEYFSAATLATMFKAMARKSPAAVALVEPVDPDHDLERDPASHSFGQENSFSHNHEALLRRAGYTIIFRKTLRLGGASWVMLLASVGQRLPIV